MISTIFSTFAVVMILRIALLAIALVAAYQVVMDPAAVGEGIGTFFGAIVSGFLAASGGAA